MLSLREDQVGASAILAGTARPARAQPAPARGSDETCPCHLPLVLAVIVGTGLAAALSEHFGPAFLTLSVIIVASLVWGFET